MVAQSRAAVGTCSWAHCCRRTCPRARIRSLHYAAGTHASAGRTAPGHRVAVMMRPSPMCTTAHASVRLREKTSMPGLTHRCCSKHVATVGAWPTSAWWRSVSAGLERPPRTAIPASRGLKVRDVRC